MDALLTLQPPIRLVSGPTRCYQCGQSFDAVAIVGIVEADGYTESVILSYIETLPDELLAIIHQRFPCFGRAFSATAGIDYYANVCPRCEALAGDHYLQSPGRIFFPTDGEEAAALCNEIIVVDGPVNVVASYGASSWLDAVS